MGVKEAIIFFSLFELAIGLTSIGLQVLQYFSFLKFNLMNVLKYCIDLVGFFNDYLFYRLPASDGMALGQGFGVEDFTRWLELVA